MGVFFPCSPVRTGHQYYVIVEQVMSFFSAPCGRRYKNKTFTRDIAEKQLFHTERLTFFST
ncbi:MAG: hypothetical protein D3906_03960 [Candidatus Electrothrix sp. AUS1_2]|nr:hypothetical protein [Candidatus Electrothrix sp. AUS1_2]